MATVAQAAERDQSFWQKMAIGIAVFILFGFGQFAARGFVDYANAPPLMHLHGLVMLGWLTISVVQPFLVNRGDIALHRKLGWISLFWAAGVVIVGSSIGFFAIKAGIQPPFFTPPYFLALTQVGLLVFAGTIAWAIAKRRDTAWHRRLMIGSSVLIMEPALGRLLPMPLIMPWGEWAALAVQLGTLAIVVRHDRKTLGAVHPATLAAMLTVVAAHLLIEGLAILPAWQALTARVIAG